MSSPTAGETQPYEDNSYPVTNVNSPNQSLQKKDILSFILPFPKKYM